MVSACTIVAVILSTNKNYGRPYWSARYLQLFRLSLFRILLLVRMRYQIFLELIDATAG